MKVRFLAVSFALVLAQSASAFFVTIDQQATTPNLLVFDIGWELHGDQTVPGENSFLDKAGNLLWLVGMKDQFSGSTRIADVSVSSWDPLNPPLRRGRDDWSFFYDGQRHFDRLEWQQWDEQSQTGERTPADVQTSNPWWDVATFTLVDPYSARITYAVPEPGVLAIAALSAGLCVMHRKLQ